MGRHGVPIGRFAIGRFAIGRFAIGRFAIGRPTGYWTAQSAYWCKV